MNKKFGSVFFAAAFVLLAISGTTSCRQPSDTAIPQVTKVVVTPDLPDLVYERDHSYRFNVAVTAVNGASTAVEWSLEGYESDGTTLVTLNTETAFTSQSSKTAVLRIAAGEIRALAKIKVIAMSKFNSSKQDSVVVDVKPLTSDNLDILIDSAKSLKEGVQTASQANAVPVGIKWVTADEMKALDDAIAKAEEVKSDPASGASEIEEMFGKLDKAMKDFQDAMKEGTGSDKNALILLLSLADSTRSGVVVNTTAAAVPVGTKWVTQDEWDNFSFVYGQAISIVGEPNTTTEQISAIIGVLNTAINVFDAAKKNGTKADKSDLTAEIAKAKTARIGVVISTAATEVPVGTKWVTQAQLDAFDTAIENAQKVSDTVAPTEAAVRDAVVALRAAISTFEAALKDGSFIRPIDKAALSAAILAAETARLGVQQSSRADTVTKGTQWVTAAVWGTFNTAISAAQAVEGNPQTQAQVDTAAYNLTGKPDPLPPSPTDADKGAIRIFKAAIQLGTFEPSADKGLLLTAIADAKAAIADVLTGVSAETVQSGAKWATAQEKAEFNALISNAEAEAARTNLPQAEMVEMAEMLEAATITFKNETVKTGTLIIKSALQDALVRASAAKAGVAKVPGDYATADVVPTGITWVSDGDLTTFDAAIATAQTVYDNGAATQDAINNAVTALNAAISTFNGKKAVGAHVSSTNLEKAIDDARAARSGILVRESAGLVPVGVFYVTQAEWDAFDAQIATAVTYIGNSEQTTVETATNTITGQTSAFKSLKKEGTWTLVVKDQLKASIANANAAKPGVVTADSAYNVMLGNTWVTPAAMAAFNDAIADAEDVLGSEDVTQTEVDAEKAKLDTAITTFNTAKGTGTRPDTAALAQKIVDANAALSGAQASPKNDGSEYFSNIKWVPQATWNALDTAIQEAVTLRDAPPASNQTAVDSKVTDLQTKMAAFTGAMLAGTKKPTGLITVIYTKPGDLRLNLAIKSEYSKIKNEVLEISLGAGSNLVLWRLDGMVGGSGLPIRIAALGNNLGPHYLTLVVMQNGEYSSEEVTFKVVN